MNTAPIQLVTAPTLADEIRDGIIAMLQGLLADAERGDLQSIIVISERNGSWGHDSSRALDFPRAIGQVEIVKDRLMQRYHEDMLLG